MRNDLLYSCFSRLVGLIALLFLSASSICQPCNRVADSLELVRFHNALSETPWKVEWNFSEPIHTWFGITLTEEGGVKSIELDSILGDGYYYSGPGNNLKGQLPSDLVFPCLEKLILSGNMIEGPIPDFQGLPKLQWLVARDNQLSGSLPEFSALPELTVISIIANNLSGTLPSFQACQKLSYINLSCNNQLSGNIPAYNLPNLGELQVSGCGSSGGNLSGTLHDFVGTPKLAYMRLSNNNFTGTLPDFQLPEILELDIAENNLSGEIPDFSGMPQLRHLSMRYNDFEGEVPPFTYCQKLETMHLSGCFSGLHPDFPRAVKLYKISIPGSCLKGSIPNLANLTPNISNVELNDNYFDEMPVFAGSTNWSNLHVEGNRLTFEDILPNVGIGALQYASQRNIWNDTIIRVSKCTPLLLDLNIDENLTSNTYAWTLNGAPFATSNTNKLLIPAVAEAGVYRCEVTNEGAPLLTLRTGSVTVLVEGSSDCNCPDPTFALTPAIDTICKYEQVQIILENTQPGYQYQLLQNGIQIGNAITGNTSAVAFSTPELSESATFSIAVTETGNTSCVTALLDTARIFVSEVDTTFTISPALQENDGLIAVCVDGTNPPFEVALSPIAGLTTQPSGDCDANFVFSQLPLGNYKLTIMDAIGCEWEKFIPISLLIPMPDTPQEYPVMTPNGDGKNDLLVFYGLKPGDDTELVILNRYGNVLFRERPYGQDWDGTYEGNNLPDGSYPFSLTIYYTQSYTIVRGYITILND
ncbi:MAG: gliding motility-associated C-terminal domain-containing protein [Saprospiraceae bacterium]|nr:gliding motility-associated C-terminal domain-containing protein [Saprospiraceae bacterium]